MVIFGISRSHGGVQVEEGARKFAERLSARAGVPVELRVERDYQDLFDALTTGRVTLAWLPPLLYARSAVDGLTLAAVPERAGGLLYRSAILVARAAPFRSAAELRATRAAWADQNSASGYMFPRQYLVAVGVTFSTETFHGSPNVAAEEVTAGRADLSTCPVSGDEAAQASRGIRDVLGATADLLRVLAVTDAIPPDGLVFSPAARKVVKKQLASALLELHEDEAGLLAIRLLFNAERLIASTDATSRMFRRRT
jgi:phosphonate transport system substrate-binding protein